MDRQRLNQQVAEAADIPRRRFIIGVLCTVVVTLGAFMVVMVLLLGRLADIGSQLVDLGNANKANTTATVASQDLLVDCVTPGPNQLTAENPLTGHGCWDRLHDPKGADAAVAVIVDDLYCDQRRAQAKLPPVPDPRKPCRDQTDPSVYPRSAP